MQISEQMIFASGFTSFGNGQVQRESQLSVSHEEKEKTLGRQRANERFDLLATRTFDFGHLFFLLIHSHVPGFMELIILEYRSISSGC